MHLYPYPSTYFALPDAVPPPKAELVTDARVEEVVCEGERAVGVRLEDGTMIHAKRAVVSGAGATRTHPHTPTYTHTNTQITQITFTNSNSSVTVISNSHVYVYKATRMHTHPPPRSLTRTLTLTRTHTHPRLYTHTVYAQAHAYIRMDTLVCVLSPSRGVTHIHTPGHIFDLERHFFKRLLCTLK